MSEIRATTISNAAGTGPATLTGQSAAKAWVYFNQLNVIVSQSFNISSVTDSATGDARHNLSNAMSATLFPVNANNGFSSSENGVYANNDLSGSMRTLTSAGDRHVNVSIHGDLA